VEDGSAFAQLWSEWTLLEKERNRRKKDFWKDADRARRYARSKEVLDDCRALFQEGADLEIRTLTSLLDPSIPLPEGQAGRFREHRRRAEELFFRLYDLLYPGNRRCMLCLYGPSDPVARLFDLYAHAAGKADLQVTDLGVYRTAAGEVKLHGQDLGPKPQFLGLECEVEGCAAALFFGEEGGLHIVEERSRKQQKVMVVVETVRRIDYPPRRPENTHRKAFFQGHLPRRRIRSDGFEDRLTGHRVSGADLVPAFGAFLFDRFERAVFETLTE
jgi:hypothetical protein